MLADSVEAASRSLDEPSHKRLKSLVDLLFRERIEDGQLDDTDLTFQDLRLIKDTFLKMLMGIYHVRVKYPDQEEEEPEEKEPTVVAVMGEEPYADVSLKVKEGPWGVEASSDADQLDEAPGFRDPRKPRPELAEASPHSHAGEGASADGASGAPPPEAPPSEPIKGRDDLPDPKVEDDFDDQDEDVEEQREASDNE
jgi:hypothetical protein